MIREDNSTHPLLEAAMTSTYLSQTTEMRNTPPPDLLTMSLLVEVLVLQSGRANNFSAIVSPEWGSGGDEKCP